LRDLQCDVSIAELFAYPSLRALARRIEHGDPSRTPHAAAPSPTAKGNAESLAALRTIEELMLELGETERELLRRIEIEGSSAAEVGRSLGLAPHEVQARLDAARAQLKAAFQRSRTNGAS
jgi:DNA-directed RNA polymerase specialized sigma24 family protein